jgi:hypothetical protein
MFSPNEVLRLKMTSSKTDVFGEILSSASDSQWLRSCARRGTHEEICLSFPAGKVGLLVFVTGRNRVAWIGDGLERGVYVSTRRGLMLAPVFLDRTCVLNVGSLDEQYVIGVSTDGRQVLTPKLACESALKQLTRSCWRWRVTGGRACCPPEMLKIICTEHLRIPYFSVANG